MRHKWSIKKVKKGSSAYCVNCGLIKEMSDSGKIFYFYNDSTKYNAGECPNKQIYNIAESTTQQEGDTLCGYGNTAYNLTHKSN